MQLTRLERWQLSPSGIWSCRPTRHLQGLPQQQLPRQWLPRQLVVSLRLQSVGQQAITPSHTSPTKPVWNPASSSAMTQASSVLGSKRHEGVRASHRPQPGTQHAQNHWQQQRGEKLQSPDHCLHTIHWHVCGIRPHCQVVAGKVAAAANLQRDGDSGTNNGPHPGGR